MRPRCSTLAPMASREPICYRAAVHTPVTPLDDMGPFERWIIEAVGRPRFWLAFIAGLLCLMTFLIWKQDLPPVPAVFVELPDFSLTDHDGRPFTKENMAGRVWIANFIFTRCPTICSTLTERMSKLQIRQRNTGGDVRLLSITVDPEFDTPAILKAYAMTERYRWQPWKWTWVTGTLKDIERVVVSGFKMALDRPDDAEDDLLSITHGSKLVLVDRWGRLRGFYDADDEDEARLMRDVAVVANLERYGLRTNAEKDHGKSRANTP